jgi:8-oxo-dGTP diphosphatase
MKGPMVGVGVFVIKGDEFLLGLRKGSHGAGEWALPGGHLEPGESFEDCCMREVSEETGLLIKNIKPLGFTNDIFEEEGLHYVTLFFSAHIDGGELVLMEPDKCEEWRWFKNETPSNIWPPLRQFLQNNAIG